jgi:threonyl-tRNA synthetase
MILKKAQKKAGYEMVMTPHIGQKELYVTSDIMKIWCR